jgi:hypothetical protein
MQGMRNHPRLGAQFPSIRRDLAASMQQQNLATTNSAEDLRLTSWFDNLIDVAFICLICALVHTLSLHVLVDAIVHCHLLNFITLFIPSFSTWAIINR